MILLKRLFYKQNEGIRLIESNPNNWIVKRGSKILYTGPKEDCERFCWSITT
jgi:hypothetical protein